VIEVADLPGLLGPADGGHLLFRALGGQDGEAAGQQVVAGVPVLDVDQIAGTAESGDVSGKDNLHVIAPSSAQRAVDV
jgi:hypothetical protein